MPATTNDAICITRSDHPLLFFLLFPALQANATIDGMLKKEKAMQRTIDEINLKLRDAQNELEASQVSRMIKE